MSRWRIGLDGFVTVVVEAESAVHAVDRAAAALAQLQPEITFRGNDEAPFVWRNDGERWYEYEEEGESMTDNVFLATLAGALRDLARTDELQGTAAVLELERIAASCDRERTGGAHALGGLLGPDTVAAVEGLQAAWESHYRDAPPVSGPEVAAAVRCECGHELSMHECRGVSPGGGWCPCAVDPPIGPRAEEARALGLLDERAP